MELRLCINRLLRHGASLVWLSYDRDDGRGRSDRQEGNEAPFIEMPKLKPAD